MRLWSVAKEIVMNPVSPEMASFWHEKLESVIQDDLESIIVMTLEAGSNKGSGRTDPRFKPQEILMLTMLRMRSKAAIRGELRWLWEIIHTENPLDKFLKCLKTTLVKITHILGTTIVRLLCVVLTRLVRSKFLRPSGGSWLLLSKWPRFSSCFMTSVPL